MSSAPAGAAASRRRLLVALATDNVGSGLFLPLTIVYLIRVIGLPVAVAGVVVTVGTLAGLLVPALAGRVVDRVGPRAVVMTSMLVQALGTACYLVAGEVTGAVAWSVVAAATVAAGTQMFYSALFGLIADLAEDGPKDAAFATVAMVRSAAFGVGALLAALLLALADESVLRVAVGVDAATFLLAAGLLAGLVVPKRHPAVEQPGEQDLRSVLSDRPYLVLIVAVGLIMLVDDVFLIGLPVYALDQLHTPGWVPGLCLALLTASTSTASRWMVHRTHDHARTSVVAAGAVVLVGWCAASAAVTSVPRGAAGWCLIGVTVLLVAGNLLTGSRVNALAEAAAPPARRGRYLAAFQYAFTGAGLLAPLVVALFAVSSWLPWLVLAPCAALGGAAMPWLARRLPADAVRPLVEVGATR